MLDELIQFAKKPVYQQDENLNFNSRFNILLRLLAISLALSILLLIIASILEQLLNLEIGKHAIDDLFENNSAVEIFFLAVLIAPFLEELLFRAPLFFFKDSVYFPKVFYLFTLTFGYIHISNFQLSTQVWVLSPLLVAPQIGVGLVLGFIRVKFGLIWSIGLHAAYNFILMLPLVIFKILDIPIE